jgi:hypothetical protein
MSQALDLLQSIHAQNARIIELLEGATGKALQHTGDDHATENRTFLPGTGWTSPLPTEPPKAQPKPEGAGKEASKEARARLAASAAAREALATTRKDLA